MSLRINDTAPNFMAKATQGPIAVLICADITGLAIAA